jgi:hypothetical protein
VAVSPPPLLLVERLIWFGPFAAKEVETVNFPGLASEKKYQHTMLANRGEIMSATYKICMQLSASFG